MYALLMLKATGLGELVLIRNAAHATTGRRSHDDSALLAQINATAFPEDALHLRGDKVSGAKESAALIEPVMQALRSIAKDPEALAGCGAAPQLRVSEFILAKKNRQTGWDSPISHSQRAAANATKQRIRHAS